MDCNNCENFKPTKGKNISTSYSIGDEFWIMDNNTPLNLQITEIYICVTSITITEEYYLEPLNKKLRFRMSVKKLDTMCRTKEELMKKVFT